MDYYQRQGLLLVDYLRMHGMHAMYSLLDDVIYAQSPGDEWEVVEPRMSLVRAWLGY